MRDRELLAVDRDHAVDHLAFALADTPHVHRRCASIVTPYDAARLIRSATLALRITFLLGRQAMFGHDPPIKRPLDHDDGPALLRQVPGDVLARLTSAEDDVLDVYGLSHGGPRRLVKRWLGSFRLIGNRSAASW